MDDAFIYTSRGPYRQYKLLVRGECVTGFDTIPHRTPRREGFRRVKTAMANSDGPQPSGCFSVRTTLVSQSLSRVRRRVAPWKGPRVG